MKYIIGVDGGGTKTEAVAYDFEGNVLAQAFTGLGNLVVNKEEALNNIGTAIENIFKLIKKDECEGIYLGLAGVESGNNREIVRAFLMKTFNKKIEVYNDADIALSALLEGNEGILTIAGTGSICYGIYKGKQARAGGWGHLIGDEGSGYYIAMEAFKNMALEQDNNIPYSALTKALLKELNFKRVDEIKGFIYSSPKADIAALAPIISEEAKKGEEKAIEILKNAGRDLAKITEMVYKSLEINDTVKIGLKGSIITKVDIVKESFKEYLDNTIKNYELYDEDISAAKGAYYFALKDLKEGIV